MALPILRTIGLQTLRVVGPLSIANYLLNPSFEGASGGIVTSWDPLGSCVLQSQTTNVKFGLAAGQFTISSSSGVQDHGIRQIIQDQVQQDSDYIFSFYVQIPSALPVPLMARVNFFDPDGVLVLTQSGQLLTGAVTNGYVRPSYLVTVPGGATQMEVQTYLNVDTSVHSVPAFYIDGALVSIGDTLGPFVQGDQASYIWSDGLYSTTLQTNAPSALKFFETRGMPDGGMGAVATMYGPNIIPVVK